jgi:hypothetical protein
VATLVTVAVLALVLGVVVCWPCVMRAQAVDTPIVKHVTGAIGLDLGALINRAYLSLPPTGGTIIVDAGGAFATPIVFDIKDKPVLLQGASPGDVVTLTYTASSGTAITFDYGTGHRMGHGLRDITVTGPGNSTATVGVRFGGMNGAEGIAFRDFKLQGFGINLLMGSNTWLALFEHGMIRDGGTNVLLPSNLIQAGEQIVFQHVTFADAPPPHLNSVWVQGNGQEVVFDNCSFDQAQLRIGNQSSGAQIAVRGSHFENPNFAQAGAQNYRFIVIDENPGNLLRLSGSFFEQDVPSGGPDAFIEMNGGSINMSGIGMFTPRGSPLQHFVNYRNPGLRAAVSVFGFRDLSGNIIGSPF